MEKRKSPKGFIVVLPGEIIEIPQDSDKSWLTLFYSLPRELAEKWKPAYNLPRCPYEVLRTDKYDHIVCDDVFKLLVWDCYAWSAWQFFQVKDRKGNYRDIPGSWTQYSGFADTLPMPLTVIVLAIINNTSFQSAQSHKLFYMSINMVNPCCRYPCYHQTHSRVHDRDHNTTGHSGIRSEVDSWHNRRYIFRCAVCRGERRHQHLLLPK